MYCVYIRISYIRIWAFVSLLSFYLWAHRKHELTVQNRSPHTQQWSTNSYAQRKTLVNQKQFIVIKSITKEGLQPDIPWLLHNYNDFILTVLTSNYTSVQTHWRENPTKFLMNRRQVPCTVILATLQLNIVILTYVYVLNFLADIEQRPG
jgi:hypothetical protein